MRMRAASRVFRVVGGASLLLLLLGRASRWTPSGVSVRIISCLPPSPCVFRARLCAGLSPRLCVREYWRPGLRPGARCVCVCGGGAPAEVMPDGLTARSPL